MKKIIIIIIFAMIFFISNVRADNYILKGKVLDENGLAFQYVSVGIQNLGRGGITNENGEFSIPVPENRRYRIQISMIGYEKIEDTISPSDYKTYNLNVDPILIDEIVVIGKKPEEIPKEKIIPIEEYMPTFNFPAIPSIAGSGRRGSTIGSTGRSYGSSNYKPWEEDKDTKDTIYFCRENGCSASFICETDNSPALSFSKNPLLNNEKIESVCYDTNGPHKDYCPDEYHVAEFGCGISSTSITGSAIGRGICNEIIKECPEGTLCELGKCIEKKGKIKSEELENYNRIIISDTKYTKGKNLDHPFRMYLGTFKREGDKWSKGELKDKSDIYMMNIVNRAIEIKFKVELKNPLVDIYGEERVRKVLNFYIELGYDKDYIDKVFQEYEFEPVEEVVLEIINLKDPNKKSSAKKRAINRLFILAKDYDHKNWVVIGTDNPLYHAFEPTITSLRDPELRGSAVLLISELAEMNKDKITPEHPLYNAINPLIYHLEQGRGGLSVINSLEFITLKLEPNSITPTHPMYGAIIPLVNLLNKDKEIELSSTFYAIDTVHVIVKKLEPNSITPTHSMYNTIDYWLELLGKGTYTDTSFRFQDTRRKVPYILRDIVGKMENSKDTLEKLIGLLNKDYYTTNLVVSTLTNIDKIAEEYPEHSDRVYFGRIFANTLNKMDLDALYKKRLGAIPEYPEKEWYEKPYLSQRVVILINHLYDNELEAYNTDILGETIIKNLDRDSVYYLLSLGGEDMYSHTFLNIYYINIKRGEYDYSFGSPRFPDFLNYIQHIDSDNKYTSDFILTLATFNKLAEVTDDNPGFILDRIKEILSTKDDDELIKINAPKLAPAIGKLLDNQEYKYDTEDFLLDNYHKLLSKYSKYSEKLEGEGLLTLIFNWVIPRKEEFSVRLEVFAYLIKSNCELNKEGHAISCNKFTKPNYVKQIVNEHLPIPSNFWVWKTRYKGYDDPQEGTLRTEYIKALFKYGDKDHNGDITTKENDDFAEEVFYKNRGTIPGTWPLEYKNGEEVPRSELIRWVVEYKPSE